MKAYLSFIAGCFIGALIAIAVTAIIDLRRPIAALIFAVVTPLTGSVSERVWKQG